MKSDAIERFSAFKLAHIDHKHGELIHYVGSPCSVEEIEKRLEKNVVTHVWTQGAWREERTVNEQYQRWIVENVEGDGYGKCAEATLAMAAAFSELKRVRGHYFCPVWGMRSHWWLTAADGSVIDPTAAQFPSSGTGLYVQWNEGDEEPTGKCANCAEYVYGGRDFCSDKCARETERYLMTGVL